MLIHEIYELFRQRHQHLWHRSHHYIYLKSAIGITNNGIVANNLIYNFISTIVQSKQCDQIKIAKYL